MKISRACGWVSLGAGLVLGAASCEGKNDVSEITGLSRAEPSAQNATGASRCVPGQTLACVGVCSGFAIGYQVCAADGLSYGECICPPVIDYGSMSVDPGGGRATVIPPRLGPSGGSPLGAPGGPIQGSASIGARCELDEECGSTLLCMSASSDSFGVGGPAGGYCTMGCADSSECQAVDRSSTCGVIAGRSMCLHSCQSQDPPLGEDKCLERSDLTCVSLAASGDVEPSGAPQFGICAPNCQSDAGCGDRRCDLSSGLCRDEPRAGAAIGAACAEPASCAAGLCLGAQPDSSGVCSAFCTLGVAGCGFDGSEDTIGAACLLPQVPGEGNGDRGLCFALCDLDEDCDDGFVCVPDPTATESGRGGVCVPPAFVAPAPEPPEPPDAPEPPATARDAGLPPGDAGELAPACTLDENCGDQVCDAVALECIDAPPAPIGAACSDDAECLGDAAGAQDTRLCLELLGSSSCSAACLLGTPLGCEAYGTDAFCVLPAQDDIGFCLELCNASEECEQVGYECVAIGVDINGRSGACLPPEPPAAPETP